MTLLDPIPPVAHECDGACEHHAPSPSRIARLMSLMTPPVRGALLAGAAVLAIDAGGTDDGAGLCVFRRCTGGYCPGCGLTRSARHLTRGELGAAWHDHPWLVLVAVQAVIAAVVIAAVRRVGRVVNWNRVVQVVGAFNVVLSLTIWIVRLVDGSIPRFF